MRPTSAISHTTAAYLTPPCALAHTLSSTPVSISSKHTALTWSVEHASFSVALLLYTPISEHIAHFYPSPVYHFNRMHPFCVPYFASHIQKVFLTFHLIVVPICAPTLFHGINVLAWGFTCQIRCSDNPVRFFTLDSQPIPHRVEGK